MDNREKQAAFKARMRGKGYVLVADWIPAGQREAFKRFAKELREQHTVTSTGMVTSKDSVTSNAPVTAPPITVPVQPIVATVTDQSSNIETQADRQARQHQDRLAYMIKEEAKQEAKREAAKRDLSELMMPDPMPMRTPPPNLIRDEGDDLYMSAIAYELGLPEHLTPQQIMDHLKALPDLKTALAKINRALRKIVTEDMKRRHLEKAGGYAVLREPSIF